jgi:hypothetical protein
VNKQLVERIAYYTRKVAERRSVNKAEKLPNSYTFRHQRLMTYKKLMHQQITSADY